MPTPDSHEAPMLTDADVPSEDWYDEEPTFDPEPEPQGFVMDPAVAVATWMADPASSSTRPAAAEEPAGRQEQEQEQEQEQPAVRRPSIPAAELRGTTDLAMATAFVADNAARVQRRGVEWLVWQKPETNADDDYVAGGYWRKMEVAPTKLMSEWLGSRSGGMDARTVKELGSTRKAKDVLTLVESDPKIHRNEADWDAATSVLTVANGVVDLATGELSPHDPNLLITHRVPVSFDPDAKAPKWEAFVESILLDADGNPDPEFLAWAHRAVGYSISGSVEEERVLMAVGTGSNGKSTFLNTLLRVLGPTVSGSITHDAIMSSRNGAHMSAPMEVRGLRFCVASELPPGRLNEASIKSLVSTDERVGRVMRQTDPARFRPTATVWMTANQAPIVAASDDGFWRRVSLVPFRAKFTGSQINRKIADELIAERAGILAWMVRGAVAWYSAGELGTCTAIEAPTAEYREDSDIVAHFLSECCVTEVPDVACQGDHIPAPGEMVAECCLEVKQHKVLEVSCAELYAAWRGWCKANGHEPGSAQSFGKRIPLEFGRGSKGSGKLGTLQRTRTGLTLSAHGVQAASWDAFR